MTTEPSATAHSDQIRVSSINIQWDAEKGTCTFEGLPVAMMWIDTTLKGLMSGVQSMVGTARFALAQQSEGRKSVEADWQVISQFPDFREGFKAIANIAAVAGWGDWQLISLDADRKECRFRVWNSWEGRFQKSLGVSWGSGMVAGKMAGYCSKLFQTNCWAEQTASIADGDEFDEFVVAPSDRSIEEEIEKLLATDEATRADMAVALQKLRSEVRERKRAEEALKRAHDELEQRVQARTAELTDSNQQLQREIAERKRAEEALRESERKTRAILDHTFQFIGLMEPDGTLIEANRAALRFGGLEESDVLGKLFWEAAWWTHSSELQNQLREGTRRAATGEFVRFEAYHPTPDGTVHYVDVSLKPVKDETGNVIFIIPEGRDITERKRAVKDETGNVIFIIPEGRDITERKRAEEEVVRRGALLRAINTVFQEVLTCENEETVARTCLTVAAELTGSQFGFIGEINEAGRFDTIALSNPGWSVCRMPDSQAAMLIRDMEIRGIWGSVLTSARSQIVNDPDSHPDRVGVPEGHPRLTAFLGVPLKQAGKTIGMIALANKPSGYDERDRQAIEDISLASVEALMRKRAEEELRKHRDHLGELVAARTRDLRKTNEELEQEVAERERAEDSLRESEEKRRAFLAHFQGIAYQVEVESVNAFEVTLFEGAVEGITGYCAEDFQNGTMKWSQLIHPEDMHLVVREGQKLLSNPGYMSDNEYRILRKGGDVRWVRDIGRIVQLEGAQLLQGAVYDITDRKQAEEAAQKAQEELLEHHRHETKRVQVELDKVRQKLVSQTRLATVGQVAASIAHELRNPLGAVRNAAYFLKRYVRVDDPKFPEYLSIIDQEVNAADRVIRDMMEMTRSKEPVKETVDLGETLRAVLNQIPVEDRLRFHLVLEPEPFTVRADPSQLQQVLGNLVTNAVQTIKGDGEVKVEARRTGDYDTITVRDSGPGIAAEHRDRLFEPLFSTRAKGTGLGLTICRQIIERHGGMIELVDHPQPGAAFRIRLPR